MCSCPWSWEQVWASERRCYTCILSLAETLLIRSIHQKQNITWWRHQMETFSPLLVLCAENSPVNVKSPHKGQWRGAMLFSLIFALDKRPSKQSWGWLFETPSRTKWRHSLFHMLVTSLEPLHELNQRKFSRVIHEVLKFCILVTWFAKN